MQTSDSAAASYNYTACLNIKNNSFVHSAISQTSTGTTGNLTNNLIKYTPSTKTSSYGVGFNRNSDQSVDIIGTASPTGYRQYSTYTLMNENLELESGTYYTNLMPENVELIGIDDDTTGYITLATNTKSYFTLPKTTTFSSIILGVKKDLTVNATAYPYISSVPFYSEDLTAYTKYEKASYNSQGLHYKNNYDGTYTVSGTTTAAIDKISIQLNNSSSPNSTLAALESGSYIIPDKFTDDDNVTGYFEVSTSSGEFDKFETRDLALAKYQNQKFEVGQYEELLNVYYNFHRPYAAGASVDLTLDIPSLYKIEPVFEPYGYIIGPELVLTVKKNGTTLLTQDITTQKESICIPTTSGGTTTLHTISAAANKRGTDEWQVSVTFKNYDTNQIANANKTFNASFDFTRIQS